MKRHRGQLRRSQWDAVSENIKVSACQSYEGNKEKLEPKIGDKNSEYNNRTLLVWYSWCCDAPTDANLLVHPVLLASRSHYIGCQSDNALFTKPL